MAFTMYNNNSSKRGYFYDVRNLPYGYYGMHPMDQAVVEYQRGRQPTKLPTRQLNRQFKPVSIQLAGSGAEDEQQVLTISVVQQQQQGKQKQQQLLVLTSGSGEDSEAIAASTVTLPELQAVKLVQRLRKLIKWKPGSGSQLPTISQGLAFEDTVFKALIVPLPGQPQQHGLKILAESRSRDPQERRELSSVLLPMEPGCLAKFRSALADLVTTETPLYHTESLQVSDGSKFYLDLIREDAAHYLKMSHVTRDFRSIVIVPAVDVAALRDLLDSSLKVMQSRQQPGDESSKELLAKQQRKGGRNTRRRPRFTQRKRRNGTGGWDEAEEKENENNSSSSNSSGAATAEAVDKPSQQQQQAAADDVSTVESRPVENGDQTAVVSAE